MESGEKTKPSEKEPKPWFVIDGEKRRFLREQLKMEEASRRYNPGAEQKKEWQDLWRKRREEIEECKPLELYTAEDGKNLLETLGRAVGGVTVEAFTRSDGKTVEVQDLSSTGVVIKVPREISAANGMYLTGSIQVLRLGETSYLWAKLRLKLQEVGMKEPGLSEGGRGNSILKGHYSSLVKSGYPKHREELGAEKGEELKPL